jgi:5'-3' exonuclease
MDIMKTKGMNRENLMLVDFLNLCFRYKHANKKNFTAEVVNTIQSLGKSYEAKDIIILGDWGSKWRKEIYPEYKANREEMKAKQTPEEQQAFTEFLEEANRALEILKEQYIVFKFKGVEADDIAAYIVKNYNTNYVHTWLISSDKDWDLLIKSNVSRFSYVTRKEITWNNWNSHYEYAPEDHISIKVLQGDTGDNVPGVAGIGIKRAVTLVNTYGSAIDIYDQLPIDSKYVYIKNLNEFGDNLLLNYDLMDLETNCEEAIGRENINKIVETLEC